MSTEDKTPKPETKPAEETSKKPEPPTPRVCVRTPAGEVQCGEPLADEDSRGDGSTSADNGG